jgi:hypothetical protein
MKKTKFSETLFGLLLINLGWRLIRLMQLPALLIIFIPIIYHAYREWRKSYYGHQDKVQGIMIVYNRNKGYYDWILFRWVHTITILFWLTCIFIYFYK